jgi:hypothetical protein
MGRHFSIVCPPIYDFSKFNAFFVIFAVLFPTVYIKLWYGNKVHFYYIFLDPTVIQLIYMMCAEEDICLDPSDNI